VPTNRADTAEQSQPGSGRTVADAIREAISTGEFAPNQRLVEADLSDQFGASRASVRIALIELSSEGLVERIQNRGARVRAVSLEEAIAITEVRMVVEGLCAAKAAERATVEDCSLLREIGVRMQTAVWAGDLLGYSELNNRLHSAIRTISGQRTAEMVLNRLRSQNVRHRFRLAMHPGRASISLPQHLAIIDAICNHNIEAAEKAIRLHLGSVIEALPEVEGIRSRGFGAAELR